MERPLGQYLDRPDAFMPCCPSCGSARVTPKDGDGLQDCLACGIWFDPCLREELTTYLATLEAKGQARVIRVRDLEAALEAREAGAKLIPSTAALHWPGGFFPGEQPAAYRLKLRAAAHLARKALGEGGA